MFKKRDKIVVFNHDCDISSAIIVKAPENGKKFYLNSKDVQIGRVVHSNVSACVDFFGSPQPVGGYVKGVLVDAKSKDAKWFLDINLLFKKENSKSLDTLKIRQYFYEGKL